MRLTLTLPSTLLFTLNLCSQWTPLGSGVQSSRGLTSFQGDLYCASYTNGVKKSVGGTGPFTNVNSGLPAVGGYIYVQSVGADDTYLYAGTESGIYRSADAGASWTSTNGSLTATPTVYANKFFTFGPNLLAVFAGSIAEGGGIWRSGNNGNTWLIGHSGMGSNVVVYHITQVGNTLWASTSTGLYSSTDNAQNWTALPAVNYTVYALAALNNTLVIASTYGIRYSTNGGSSWLDATGDPAAPTDGELIAFDGYLLALLPSPSGCLKSTDNGVTWTDYNAGFGVVDAQAQEEFMLNGNTLYCTALFDLYSLASTGNGLTDAARSAELSVYPTVFDESFTLRNDGVAGTLVLLGMDGRVVRSLPTGGRSTVQVDRNGLAAGAYQVFFHPQAQGERQRVGTIVAR